MKVFKRIEKKDWYQLLELFKRNKDNKFFDPFPLNKKSVEAIVKDNKNLYVGIFLIETIIGFCMLRWHKDFKVPTLGLLVDKDHRNEGLGKAIYKYLLGLAKIRQCPGIIAIIHKDNIPSMTIAKRLGMVELDKLKLADNYDFTDYTARDRVILIKKYYEEKKG